MSQPTPYQRQADFTDYQTNNPGQPMSGSDLDNEHNAEKVTLDAILANMALLQRDDTALSNATVHPDALNTATLALIAGDWVPKGLWTTATIYSVSDVVEEAGTSYVCAEAHTAGTFATDHAAGKWVVLGFGKNTIQSGADVFAIAAGTVDAITAAFTPAVGALTDGMELRVRASGANTITNPTFNPDGIGAKTITRFGNQPLIVGDIDSADHELHLRYNLTNDVIELLNPSLLNHSTMAADAHPSSAINNVIQIVATVATLRTIAPNANRDIRTSGVISANDGGGGDWFALTGAAPGTYVDDIGLTVVPTAGDGSTAWRRRENGQPLDPVMFDAKGDDATLATAAIQAALDTARDVNFNVKGIYQCVDLRPGSNQKMTFAYGVVLKQPNNSSVSGSGVITLSGVSGVKIHDPVIDGNAANNTSVAGGDWPWHGIVVSSASTDSEIIGGYIYDCFVDDATYPDGQCADLYIRANSRRIRVKGGRYGKSNNNIILQDAYHCEVSDVELEDNISSEALSLFGTTTSRDIWHYNTVSNIRSDNCRQTLSIANSAGNTVNGVAVENWRDAAVTIRTGGNTVSNIVIRAGENTGAAIATHESIDGRFPVTCDTFDSANSAKGILENVIVDIAGWFPPAASNCFQLTNDNFQFKNCHAVNGTHKWEAGVDYELGEFVIPDWFDGVIFECTTDGTSDGSEPTFNYTAGNKAQGATTNDNTVVWTAHNVPDISGFNFNAANDTDAINCTASKMPTIGAKVQGGCHNLNLINLEADRNWQWGLLVSASSWYGGSIQGGRYSNNSLDRGSKTGILITDTDNYGITITNDVRAYDDQLIPTQGITGISPGADAANLTTASSAPKRGLWRLNRRAYRRSPTASLSGWYVFGRDDSTVKVAVSSGVAVDVVSTTGMGVNDSFGMRLDDGTWHWSRIASVVDADSITIDDAVPSLASIGNHVATHQWVAF